MSSLPKSLQKVSEFFEKLPGIGSKTAKRLSFYLLRMPDSDLQEAAKNLADLKASSKKCEICLNLTEDQICSICNDGQRDSSSIAVVEEVLDLLSFEAAGKYQGVYHVLHGRIDPLHYIGPDDIYIDHFLKRISQDSPKIKEIILATNPTTEGEATAMYIKKKIEEQNKKIKITRLAYGLPMGADLEYADFMTLGKAIENRQNF